MSIGRFIGYYEVFIREVEGKGLHQRYTNDSTSLKRTIWTVASPIDDKKVYCLPSSDFTSTFLEDLKGDLLSQETNSRCRSDPQRH